MNRMGFRAIAAVLFILPLASCIQKRQTKVELKPAQTIMDILPDLSIVEADFNDLGEVGKFRVQVPKANRDRFTFTVMVPVPSDFEKNKRNSIGYVDVATGKLRAAQTKVITRDPLGRAEVLRVMGELTIPPGLPDDYAANIELHKIRYASNSAMEFFEGSFTPPTMLFDLYNPLSANSVYIVIKDAWGFYYVRDVMDLSNLQVIDVGHFAMEVNSYGYAMPFLTDSAPVHPGSYPHPAHLGIMSNIVVAQDNIVQLRLLFDNGRARTNGSPLSVPLGNTFIESMDIVIPKNMKIRSMFTTKYSDYRTPRSAIYNDELQFSNHDAYPIVKADNGGKFHFIHAMQQFNRYFALTYEDEDPQGDLAQKIARFGGLGFLRTDEKEYSWTDSGNDSGRFSDQKYEIPTFDYKGVDQVRSDLSNFLQQIESDYQNDHEQYVHPGTYGQFKSSGTPFKTLGIGYGGGTGGINIESTPNEGPKILYSQSLDGTLATALMFTAAQHRQFDALIRPDGRAIRNTTDYLTTENGNLHQQGQFHDHAKPEVNWIYNCSSFEGIEQEWCLDILPFFPYTTMSSNVILYEPGSFKEPDKFGFHAMDQLQTWWVIAENLYASYAPEISNYDPFDHQHYIRFLQYPMTLAWVAGFYPAIRALETAAANAEHATTIYWKNKHSKDTGIPAFESFVNQYPGHGISFGRGQAWAGRAMTSYYALADDAYRESVSEWYDRIVDLLDNAQIQCNGMLYSASNPGKMVVASAASQRFEEYLVQNMSLAFLKSVYEGTGKSQEATLKDVLARHLASLSHPMTWSEEHEANIKYVATYPVNPDEYWAGPIGEPYCTESEMPQDFTPCDGGGCTGTSEIVFDHYYIDNSYAMVYRHADPQDRDELLCNWQKMRGGSFSSLKNHLESYDYYGEDNLRNGMLGLRLIQDELSGETNLCN